MLLNRLLLTDFNPTLTWWGRLVTRILFCSCLSEPIPFQHGSLCVDLWRWISLRAGWPLWKLNEVGWGWRKQEELMLLMQAEKCMNDCKEVAVEPIGRKRNPVGQSQGVFLFPPYHPASPWLLLLTVTRSLCLPAPLNNLFHWVSVSLPASLTGWLDIHGC